jgi:tRNA-binding protein
VKVEIVYAVAEKQRACQAFRAQRTGMADLKKGHLGAQMDQISYDDFAKVDIRVGRIVQADEFPQAKKPAYKLRIDFGPELGVKNSSAQITKYYDPQDLVGKLVLGVVNFPPRQIATFFSEVLTLGVILGEGDICLVHPDRDVPLGAPIR